MRANMSGDNIDLNVFHYREKSIGPELPDGRKRNQSVSRVKRYRNRSSAPYRHTPKVEIPVKKDMKDELSQLVDVMSGQKLNDLPKNGTVQQQPNKDVMENVEQIKKADKSDIARTKDLDVNVTKIPEVTTTPINALTDSFKRLSLKDLEDTEKTEVKKLKPKQRSIRQKVKREWRKEREVPGRSQHDDHQQSILSNSQGPEADRKKKRKRLTVSFSQAVDDKDTEEVLHQAKRKRLTVSNSQEVDNKDREDVFLTTTKDDVSQTTKTEDFLLATKTENVSQTPVANTEDVLQTLQTTETEDVFQTTETEDVLQATKTENVSQTPVANTEDVLQTPETEDVFQTTETEEVFQTTKTENVFQTTRTEDVFQTIKTEHVFQTAKTEDVLQTTETKDVFQTTETEDVLQTTETKEVFQTSETENVSQTTATENVFQTTETKDVFQTTKTEDVFQTTNTEDVLQTTKTEDVFQTTKRKVRKISKDGASSKRLKIDKQESIDQKLKPKVKNEVRYLIRRFKKLKITADEHELESQDKRKISNFLSTQ